MEADLFGSVGSESGSGHAGGVLSRMGEAVRHAVGGEAGRGGQGGMAAHEGAIVRFFVPGEPRGKGRHRTRIAKGKGGKAFVHQYAPAETVEYENLVRMAAREAMAGNPLMLRPVRVDIDIQVSVPKSWSQKKQGRALVGQVMPTGKPDRDNVEKAILDGMNGIVFRDDAQACDGRIRKFYARTPGVRVFVMELDAEAAR